MIVAYQEGQNPRVRGEGFYVASPEKSSRDGFGHGAQQWTYDLLSSLLGDPSCLDVWLPVRPDLGAIGRDA